MRIWPEHNTTVAKEFKDSPAWTVIKQMPEGGMPVRLGAPVPTPLLHAAGSAPTCPATQTAPNLENSSPAFLYDMAGIEEMIEKRLHALMASLPFRTLKPEGSLCLRGEVTHQRWGPSRSRLLHALTHVHSYMHTHAYGHTSHSTHTVAHHTYVHTYQMLTHVHAHPSELAHSH